MEARRNIVEIIEKSFRRMLRSIYGQQVFPYYDWSKEDYFEQYWDIVHNFSYDVIEEFFVEKMESFTIGDEDRTALIVKLNEYNREYLPLVRNYTDEVMWKEFFPYMA